MSSYEFILDTMTWSFSRLTSFDQCKYGWKRHYIDCEDGENNFAAENGLAVHQTLEEYLNGKIDPWDLPATYDEKFNELVVHDAPANKYVDLAEKTYTECREYFENFQGLDPKYEVLGVELQENFKVGDYNFIGFIDALLRDRETGEITISDHKSHKISRLKNNNLSKKDKEYFELYKKQMYLYAVPVIKEYGRVDYLRWNLFRSMDEYIIPFKQSEYEESISWATKKIEEIKLETGFDMCDSGYYCHNLCDYRYSCSNTEIMGDEDDFGSGYKSSEFGGLERDCWI